MAMSLLARTGTKFACGATSKAGELLGRQWPDRSRGVDGLLPRTGEMPFLMKAGFKLLAHGGVTKAPAAAMLGLTGGVASRGFSSSRRPPTDPGRTFTLRKWDKQSLDEEYEHQGGVFGEHRRKQEEKDEQRHQEYLRNFRHKKYEDNFSALKTSVAKIEKAVSEGFVKMNESFVQVDARIQKTDQLIVSEICDATELSASDMMELVLLLEILIADLEDFEAAVVQKDNDEFMNMLDKIPKMKLWYMIIIASDVVISAGCSCSDVFHMMEEAHKAAIKEMEEKIEKLRK
ncbi:uncharacterized protein LOC119349840 [Triticum dicoccoides]|uniref:uncharacterized protein LOC119349840 n=1 Tax=Triticum dicoccoides TaxID=85692 RepID=UPI000E7C56F0|nr:uncharacterized protein LOC119349840 [Triticum dicoccoides]